ncbi:MAG: metal ABC transporter permease [Solirubrobacterales bacterium]|nr:metal ABC transporter permease [Solirubrobacterales bacterium]
MLDVLLEPFADGIGQRALMEVVLVGVVCGPLGVWILLFRQTYAAESISHAMLPGLVIAALAGFPLLLGAAGGVLAAAGAIALAGRDERVGPDVAVAVAITTLFGLGAALALSPEAPPRIGELLFGDLLGVSEGDLVATGLLAAAVVAVLAGSHRALALAAFDPVGARSLGTRPGRIAFLLLVLLGLTTLAAVQSLGNLLVLALIVAPAAAALNLTSRLGPALALAAALTVAAGVSGLYLSWYLDLAGGASVALCAVALFGLSLLRRPARATGRPLRVFGRAPIDVFTGTR